MHIRYALLLLVLGVCALVAMAQTEDTNGSTNFDCVVDMDADLSENPRTFHTISGAVDAGCRNTLVYKPARTGYSEEDFVV